MLLRRFTLRYYSNDWLRALLTLLGVGLGLSVLVAILIANRSALASFENFTDTVGGRATYRIESNGPPLDETVLLRLAWAQGQARFAPVLRATALVRKPDEEVLELVGLDLLQDWQFAAPPETAPEARQDFTGLLTEPRAVYVADTLATRLGLKLDGPLTVVLNGQPETLVVRGIIPTGHRSGFDDTVVYMDIAAAQTLLERLGQLDRIDVQVEPWINKAAFLRHARASLPPSVTIAPPSATQAQAEKMTRAFQLNLTALAMVALMVGMFLVYNTVAVSVVRRRPEVGIMRALGTSRGEVFSLFVLEGGTLGALGSLLGLLFGWGLSFGAVKAVAQTVDLLYVPTRPTSPVLPPWVALLALSLGFVMALLSSWIPAREAASVPPAEAMGRGAQNLLHQPDLRRVALVSAVFLGVAWALCYAPPIFELPLAGFVGCLFVLLAGAAASAPAIYLLTRAVQRPLVAAGGAPAMAATTHLLGALKRVAVAVGALTVGMAMVASVAIMVNSFRETVVAWVNQTVRADIFITAAENRSTIARGALSPEAVRIIEDTPGIRSADAFYGTQITYQGDPAFLGAGDMASIGQYGHLVFTHGDSQQILLSCIGAARCVVSEPFATRHHVHAGDTLTLAGAAGPVSLTVAGVYYDYSTEAGWVVMDRGTCERYFGPTQTTNLALYLKPGVAADAFRRDLRRRLGNRFDLSIQTSAALREQVLVLFNRTFAVTESIEIIAVVVAVLGVVTTLISLIIERRREISILRCLGTTREQIVGMVLLEAVVVAVCGILLGLLTGLSLAWILINVINKQSFGWTLIFHFPWVMMAQVTALILVATVVAAAWPARLAAQVEPAAHLRDE